MENTARALVMSLEIPRKSLKSFILINCSSCETLLYPVTHVFSPDQEGLMENVNLLESLGNPLSFGQLTDTNWYQTHVYRKNAKEIRPLEH